MQTGITRYQVVVLALLVFVFLILTSPATSDARKPEVQVQTEYVVGPVQTDASRAIDMAERVTLQNQQAIQAQLARIDAKLDRLTERMNSIDRRLAAIEQHLGISVPPPPASAPAQQKPPIPPKPAK